MLVSLGIHASAAMHILRLSTPYRFLCMLHTFNLIIFIHLYILVIFADEISLLSCSHLDTAFL